jgi:hypothetical protein
LSQLNNVNTKKARGRKEARPYELKRVRLPPWPRKSFDEAQRPRVALCITRSIFVGARMRRVESARRGNCQVGNPIAKLRRKLVERSGNESGAAKTTCFRLRMAFPTFRVGCGSAREDEVVGLDRGWGCRQGAVEGQGGTKTRRAPKGARGGHSTFSPFRPSLPRRPTRHPSRDRFPFGF